VVIDEKTETKSDQAPAATTPAVVKEFSEADAKFLDEDLTRKKLRQVQEANAKEEQKKRDEPDRIKELIEAEAKLMAGEELTRKELRQVLKTYTKEEQKKQDEPELVMERMFKIDSLAYKSDSLYWEERRPIPLTESEVRGYTLQDSLDVEAEKIADGDTLNSNKGKFSPLDILTGNTYDIGNKQSIRLHSPIPRFNFNTVDGFNIDYRVSYYKRYDNQARLEISPLVRYAFSREQVFGTVRSEYKYGNAMQSGALRVEGGWFYSQFDRDGAIRPFINSFSSLLFQNNFMKVHDRNFVEANWKHDVTPKISFDLWSAYDVRKETFNTASTVWMPIEGREFRPNTPRNLELENTSFGRSEAFKIRGAVTLKPGAKYGKRNDRYYKANEPAEFTLAYEQAFPNVFNTTIDYQLLSFRAVHKVDLHLLGELGFKAEIGTFLSQDNMDFMDFAHFKGNETPFVRGSQLVGYSLLPYYVYSTSKEYISTLVDYQLRNFLLTLIPKLRMFGVEEHIKFNYLLTPEANNYMEVGYSVTNLFRFIRIDVMSSFVDGRYSDFRIQLGLSSTLFQIE
jgi:hypothetical protein